ncbi:integrase core domain-containing protein [Aliiroseovarius crassostreae]|uniref:integrase core domain-containing protein n=1 Tax=Aliiroseovarius crassostreae TaxID=154981 RepID=UPI003C7E7A5E
MKREAIYLEEISDGFQARRVISSWMTFYNIERPHSALGGKPPAVVYWLRKNETQPDQQEQKVA